MEGLRWLRPSGPLPTRRIRQKSSRCCWRPAPIRALAATLLIWAVQRKNQRLVRRLLARGIDPAGVDKDGRTPLMMAVFQRAPGIVEALLAAGAAPGLTGSDSTTALFWAVWNEDIAMARLLLEGGANPNIDMEGNAPLTVAAGGQIPEMVQLLRQAGAREETAPVESVFEFVRRFRPARARHVLVQATWISLFERDGTWTSRMDPHLCCRLLGVLIRPTPEDLEEMREYAPVELKLASDAALFQLEEAGHFPLIEPLFAEEYVAFFRSAAASSES